MCGNVFFIHPSYSSLYPCSSTHPSTHPYLLFIHVISNSIQAEIEKVQRDIKKIKKDDDDKDKNDKKSTTTKKTKTSYLDEFKSNYATRKDIKRQELRYGRTSGGGSGGASGKEEQLLQKLEAFKTKISAASSSSANRKLSSKFSAEDDNNRCIPHGKLLCQSCVRAGDADEYDNLGQEAAVDSGFLSHELVFFEKPSQRTINDYTFIDPRIEARG